jgi:uncharacterized protein YegP (UPF0339 family)
MNRVDKLEIYQGTDDKWYWRYRRSNGRVMADGSEGYVKQTKCEEAALHVLTHNTFPETLTIVHMAKD